MWRRTFFKFPAAPVLECTDLEKVFSKSGSITELTEIYKSCLAKGELLVCKINHDQVSAEQILGLSKLRQDLFLMLINPIAPKLMVPNDTVIPLWILSKLLYDSNGLISEQKREQMSLWICVKSLVPQFNALNKIHKEALCVVLLVSSVRQ